MTDIDSHFAEIEGSKFEVVNAVTFWLDRWACGRWKKKALKRGKEPELQVIRLFVGRPVTPGAASRNVEAEVLVLLKPMVVERGLELKKLKLLPGTFQETWEEYQVELTVV